MNVFEHGQLANGLRVLYIHHPDAVVTHCAVMVRAGTRDEPEGLEGLAHYLEHCLFKGTSNRKSYHILNRLEVVGGELNAYTTKEETCLHASVMNNYLERALELITDILKNSIFPEHEIVKEKEVIRDEIHTYLDTPSEQIFDDFEGLVFRKHPLGRAILGTTDSLDAISRKDLKQFVATHYQPDQMVLSVSGNQGIKTILALAEKFFGQKGKSPSRISRNACKRRVSVHQEMPKAISQVHAVIGNAAYSLFHDDRFALVLLNNLLGGPGMNSRLNLNIREKYGFTYTIESGYHAYSDTGIFHLYFATDARNAKRTHALAEMEMQKLMDAPINERALAQYKEQLLGQMTMGQENRLSIMLSQTKAMLYFRKPVALERIVERVKAVSASKLHAVAIDIFSPDKRSSLNYIPLTKDEKGKAVE